MHLKTITKIYNYSWWAKNGCA